MAWTNLADTGDAFERLRDFEKNIFIWTGGLVKRNKLYGFQLVGTAVTKLEWCEYSANFLMKELPII